MNSSDDDKVLLSHSCLGSGQSDATSSSLFRNLANIARDLHLPQSDKVEKITRVSVQAPVDSRIPPRHQNVHPLEHSPIMARNNTKEAS